MSAHAATEAFQVRRLAYGVAAEITGLDWSRTPHPGTIQLLHEAWAAHLVLVFRDAEISLQQQVDFIRHFGEPELHPLVSFRHPRVPEIVEITNRAIDGRPSETAEVGRMWHSDGAYTVRPPAASLLRCQVIPSAGGTTWFNNMYRAYETLSETMRRTIAELEVVNDLYGDGRGTTFVNKREADKAPTDRKAVPAVVQPMVRTHPVTRRKALYLNPAVTRSVYGMTAEESQGLLHFLFQHAVKPEFLYCHRWRVHDMVLWDNRCAMHLAPPDYDTHETRLMFRTTIAGMAQGRYADESAEG